MPSYSSMLVAIVLVITIASSVSNQAPASVQWVNVPNDESHSFRSLRSLRVTDASPSSNVTSTSDESLDEPEEMGFFQRWRHKAAFYMSTSSLRLTSRLLGFQLRDADSTEQNDEIKRHLDSKSMKGHFRVWKKLGATPKQVRADLHIDKSDSFSNMYRKAVVEAYTDYLHRKPQPTN